MQTTRILDNLLNMLSGKVIMLVIVYFTIQIGLVLIFPVGYTSDSLYYYRLAQDCITAGDFYPAEFHLYEDYIVAPLYINILVLILTVFNSTVTIGFFNVLINASQLFLVYKISITIFNKKSANASVILYIFYLNTFGLALLNYTEMFFVTMLLASLYLYMKYTKASLIMAGIFIGASIAVRPVGWALLIACLLLALYFFWKEKKLQLKIINIFIGTALFVTLIGIFNYTHFGRFIFTSTTGPVNLLLGANDDATGGFNSDVYEKGKAGYIENPQSVTYIETGEFYYDQAVNWIQNNPDKWILLAPMKIVHTFAWDDIAISNLFNLKNWNLALSLKNLLQSKSIRESVPETSVTFIILYYFVQLLHHLYYYFILAMIAGFLFSFFKKPDFKYNASVVVLFFILGILMIMITVGTPRYKYPFIIIMLPFISNYILSWLGRKKKQVEESNR